MANGHADIGGLASAGLCEAQGAGALCRDRTRLAGRLGGGAYVVVLSAAEEDSSVGQITECAAVACGAKRIGLRLGKCVEQRAQHLILRADDIRAGFGEHSRLIQVHQGGDYVRAARIGDLLCILTELAAARGDCSETATLRVRQVDRRKEIADGAHPAIIGTSGANLRM
jgi:hypothetical protein